MRALPFKIPKPSNSAILFEIDEGVFYDQLHQHEEVQISLIKEGTGTLLVGDAIHTYQKGDLLILGAKQPHVFKSENSDGHMHSIFFSAKTFGKEFLNLNEGKGVWDFCAFAKAGLKTNVTLETEALFNNVRKSEGILRLGYFLLLLSLLRRISNLELSDFVYAKSISEKDGQKMNAIFEYTLKNFNGEIKLKDIAEVATMTTNAFCKYFKGRTNKTYFEFLNEIRIENACKLLANAPEKEVSDIAALSGFQTLSHFNRKFRSIKNCSPTDFKKTFSSRKQINR